MRMARSTYRELFQTLGTKAGAGDGISTFGLPAYPIEYRAGEPIRGFAICPFARPWADIADVAPFSIDSNIYSAAAWRYLNICVKSDVEIAPPPAMTPAMARRSRARARS